MTSPEAWQCDEAVLDLRHLTALWSPAYSSLVLY